MDAIHDDVAEFALLLRRLKERTDRSYAALARRLDVHASTLHRYCSGEAVPQDFAPIERFAVLCGASPQERTELHRRWIMAYAARQRPRPSDGRQAPAPRNAVSATVSVDSAGGGAASAARDVDGAVPVPVTAGIRLPGAASSSARSRFSGGRPRRRAVRSVVLAVSLVAVLLGLTASAAGPPSTSATGGGRSKPHQARAGAAQPVAPLTWTANFHTRGVNGCGEDYVVAKAPQQVPPPPHPEDVAAWVDSQRAVHGGPTGLQITVQGRGSAAVVLDALHVRVVNRAAPAADRGIVYSLSDGCGAGIVPRYFSVNLDAHQPLARSVPGDNGSGTKIPAVNFPYRVSLQEPEVLVVSTLNESCTCDWYLELAWSSQGRTGTVRIDDHGRPFRSTSTKGLTGYRYDRVYYSPGRWVPIPAVNMEGKGGDG
ncbi:helix-turn-helix domain-containing protein [Streptomyces neyagawaensis]|uniref:helix-turn-helix domain-containing protein n=1 Tax=Streptomyces neyagawaensis TaxID=42238 RepID=UPI003F4D5B09